MQARPLGLRIVYWLSVADLGASLIFVIDGASPVYELQEAHCPNFYCTLKAFFAQLFGLAAIMWSPCIALTLHLQLKVPRVVRECAAATARRRAPTPQPTRPYPRGVGRPTSSDRSVSSCGARPPPSRSSSSSSARLASPVSGAGYTPTRRRAPRRAWRTLRPGASSACPPSQWARFLFFYAPLLVAVCYSVYVYWITRGVLSMLQSASSACEHASSASAIGPDEPRHSQAASAASSARLLAARLSNRRSWTPMGCAPPPRRAPL